MIAPSSTFIHNRLNKKNHTNNKHSMNFFCKTYCECLFVCEIARAVFYFLCLLLLSIRRYPYFSLSLCICPYVNNLSSCHRADRAAHSRFPQQSDARRHRIECGLFAGHQQSCGHQRYAPPPSARPTKNTNTNKPQQDQQRTPPLGFICHAVRSQRTSSPPPRICE